MPNRNYNTQIDLNKKTILIRTMFVRVEPEELNHIFAGLITIGVQETNLNHKCLCECTLSWYYVDIKNKTSEMKTHSAYT